MRRQQIAGPGGWAGRRDGEGRATGKQPAARRERWSVRTSPSHLFLPLRQLVQARAPRFGMWADGTDGDIARPDEGSWGEAMSDRGPPLAATVKLVVRRRLPEGWSS